jgi:hypothetical protein
MFGHWGTIMAGLDPATPLNVARPCPMIGVAGTSPAMTTGGYSERTTVAAQIGAAGLYCGGSEPRYEEIAIMSSSERLATTGFINSAALPALEPCFKSKSCRAM